MGGRLRIDVKKYRLTKLLNVIIVMLRNLVCFAFVDLGLVWLF